MKNPMQRSTLRNTYQDHFPCPRQRLGSGTDPREKRGEEGGAASRNGTGRGFKCRVWAGLEVSGLGGGRASRTSGPRRGFTCLRPVENSFTQSGADALGNQLVATESNPISCREARARRGAPGKDKERCQARLTMPPAAAVPTGDRVPTAFGVQPGPGQAAF